MAGIIAGVFNTVGHAEDAVKALLHNGFSDDSIGVVVHDTEAGPVIADDLGREYRSGVNPPEHEITSPSDVYRTMPGGFVKAVREGEMRDEGLDWYRQQLDAGRIMVIVNAGTRMDDAMRILQEHGAMGYPGGQRMATPPRMEERMEKPSREERVETTGEEIHIPVIEEEVTIEKTAHRVGEVEVSSETTSRTVDIPTSVTHEEVRVERRKLDHPMHPDEYKAIGPEKGVTRMPIVEEDVRVIKEPIIREELVITRVPVTERETLHETVMHAEPHVETTGDVEIRGEEKREEKRRPAA